MKQYFSGVEKMAELFLHVKGIVFVLLCLLISFLEGYMGIVLFLFLCEMSRRGGMVFFSFAATLFVTLLSVGILFLYFGVAVYLGKSIYRKNYLSFQTYLAAFLFLLFPLWAYGILCLLQKSPDISLMKWVEGYFTLLFVNVKFSLECLLKLFQNPRGDFSFVSFLFF